MYPRQMQHHYLFDQYSVQYDESTLLPLPQVSESRFGLDVAIDTSASLVNHAEINHDSNTKVYVYVQCFYYK